MNLATTVVPISLSTILILVAISLIVAILIFIWSTYNSLVRLNERVNEAWSDITVQLKYRSDLIPNLVETVKGYAKHEKSTFEEVTRARSAVMSARGVQSTSEAEKGLEVALGKIFALAENYPELKADAGFRQLQSQLQDTEDKIQAARRFYNSGAKNLNTRVKMFPVNLFGGFGFQPREYFEVSDSEAARISEAPEVKF